ncbi:biotin--[acetyl-CoA-carboxylase] ligase [Endomicrobium proavitum]|uniref:Bifunctional ligase/repressor BirA n=1 Tax=Endomicrobium proavitum TaxID=1408281 RepID=A0A0G3WK90_9BACT|nr:biotin--[acetyl-CoA-carboxylase] ligase [Endomicrobium proavitum]AKL97914.1 Biotin operon repressor/biotin-[acetyl-CoA-carboxylase] ligase [Endomicrobium proavitum]
MKVLNLLSDKKYLSGKNLAEALSISRAAVHKQINTLKRNGYVIESSPKGYKLCAKDDVLSEQELLLAVKKPLGIFKKLLYYKKINSTQTKLKTIADAVAREGVIVCADVQTGGYGRMKREWSSSNGGLWFSMLLKPALRPDEVSKLALIISLALNRVFKQKYGVKTNIKWPNDILFKGRKASGILVDMSAEQDIVNWVVAGIGINVNNVLPKELKNISVSLGEILNKFVGRAQLLAQFLCVFDEIYAAFKKSGFKIFVKEYNDNIVFINESIKIDTGFDIIEGVNLGIDGDGKLILKTPKGLEKITAGTVVKGK